MTKAVEDMGVDWPVLLDNDFKMWNAYENSYWPSKYFIDATGEIRYYHFGEGEYDSSRKVIEKLFKEAGIKPEESAKTLNINEKYSKTHEVYLGSIRGSQTVDIENLGDWKTSGNWKFNGEFIESVSESELLLKFDAKSVNLVIESVDSGEIEVLVDNKLVSSFTPQENKMYNIVNLEKSGEHTLTLRVEGKSRLFAFTFGG